jgi:hypothetical protein
VCMPAGPCASECFSRERKRDRSPIYSVSVCEDEREREGCVVDGGGLSRGAYMFASRNLLALGRAKDAEREVCREGKGRYQHHQQQLQPSRCSAASMPWL